MTSRSVNYQPNINGYSSVVQPELQNEPERDCLSRKLASGDRCLQQLVLAGRNRVERTINIISACDDAIQSRINRLAERNCLLGHGVGFLYPPHRIRTAVRMVNRGLELYGQSGFFGRFGLVITGSIALGLVFVTEEIAFQVAMQYFSPNPETILKATV